MIGVVSNPSDYPVVQEFFELFKTPWEVCRPGGDYDVLLCDGGEEVETSARLILTYSGSRLRSDPEKAPVACLSAPVLVYSGMPLPLYGEGATFPGEMPGLLVEKQSGVSALRQSERGEQWRVRVGYSLFAEIRHLLTAGQPAEHAAIPTVDLHIALLRDVIAAAGVSLTEIPPAPPGYRFFACLTHDVDHPLIRRHRLDHTTAGFLYRATIGSVTGLARGRRTVRDAARNLLAAAKLPLVHLGIARDFWSPFDRYLEVEQGCRSSFFVIPFRDRPGRRESGPAPHWRAARYAASDVAPQMRRLAAAGCEIGTHGIDAWMDPDAGQQELAEIRRIAGPRANGIRMHWLYFDQQSPVVLEAAGFDYDSTVGYNNAIGFRAGTTQVYKPLNTTRLLELPLHVMDTALFYPSHLNLSPPAAMEQVGKIIDHAARFGGCVTVNWHDRSIAPERCWGGFYAQLLQELRNKGAWFGTAAETVAWFRHRRDARFDLAAEEAVPAAVLAGDRPLPGLDVRTLGALPKQAVTSHA